MQDKILAFNKPEVDEEAEREKQRKKASFNSKVAKFENGTNLVVKKTSVAAAKAKMFEDMAGEEERMKEAELRKEDFKKKQEAFKEDTAEEGGEETNESEVAKKKAVFEGEGEGEGEDEDMAEAVERERRREQFLEKQTVFGQ